MAIFYVTVNDLCLPSALLLYKLETLYIIYYALYINPLRQYATTEIAINYYKVLPIIYGSYTLVYSTDCCGDLPYNLT